MGDDRGVGEGCDGAALFFRDGGVEHGERLDRNLVDEAAGRQDRPADLGERVAGDDRLRHEVGGVGAEHREPGVVFEGAVQFAGIGIDEQFRRIEPGAVIGIVGTPGAVAVTGAGTERRHRDAVDVVAAAYKPMAGDFPFTLGVEEAEFDAFGIVRPDGEIGAVCGQGYAEFRVRRSGQWCYLPLPCRRIGRLSHFDDDDSRNGCAQDAQSERIWGDGALRGAPPLVGRGWGGDFTPK